MNRFDELIKQRSNLLLLINRNELLDSICDVIEEHLNNLTINKKKINETEKQMEEIANKVYDHMNYQYARIILYKKLPKKLKKKFCINTVGYGLSGYSIEFIFLIDDETRLYISVPISEVIELLKEERIDILSPINVNEIIGKNVSK